MDWFITGINSRSIIMNISFMLISLFHYIFKSFFILLYALKLKGIINQKLVLLNNNRSK